MPKSLIKNYNSAATFLVSIIIPVYNGKRYIEGCLETIKSQTYKNLEILIIDDGSTDGVDWGYIQALDKRIKIFHTPNRGVSCARNLGLERATGAYVVFVDIDDVIDSHYIETMISDATRTDSDIVTCSSIWCTSTATEIRKNTKKEFISFPNDFVSGFWDDYLLILIPIWGKLYKKSALQGLKFDESLAFYEDWEFIGLAFAKVNKIHFINYIGYYHIYRLDSATEKGLTSDKGRARIDADLETAKRVLCHYLDEQVCGKGFDIKN